VRAAGQPSRGRTVSAPNVEAPLLDYHNVTVYRGETRALDGVSLKVRVGEHVAILGPNGCGKSTLIKTFTRECYPSSGHGESHLRILGRDKWDVVELRGMLGIVTNDLVDTCTRGMSSDFAEFPRYVTARDTVLSGFFSSIGVWEHHVVTPVMREKADALLATLGVAHLADRLLTEMSSGEVRRVVIARALVHDPSSLVLDEPTNSLDLRATSELRDAVRTIAQSGMSVLLVTHHLADIIPEIERVILLQGGRIVDDGPKEKLLTSARLSELFGVTVEVGRRGDFYHAW
jgi:iron complex transport system ATP-binding protein